MERATTSPGILLAVSVGSALTVACISGSTEFPEVEGWTQVGEVRVYDTETLWDYINGGAVAFVEYGMRTCTTADLASDGISVTVDLYDMGTHSGAVGMFRSESDGNETDVTWATIASISIPYQVRLVKGSTYVKVNVYDGELTAPQGRSLLEELAASLPGETNMPEEFSLLPQTVVSSSNVGGASR